MLPRSRLAVANGIPACWKSPLTAFILPIRYRALRRRKVDSLVDGPAAGCSSRLAALGTPAMTLVAE